MTPERRPPRSRSLLANTFANAVATGLVAVLTFALAPLLIRRLGTAGYGAWVLLTVVMITGRGLASLLDLGLQQSLIARVASAATHDEAEARLGAGLRALVLIAPLAGLALALASGPIVGLFHLRPALHDDAVLGLRLLALQLVVELPTVAFASALEGLRRYDLRRGADVVRVVCFTAGAVWLSAGHGLVGVAIASVASTAVYAVTVVATVLRCDMRPTWGGSSADEVRHGMPLLALRLTGVGYRQLDKVVLGLVVGTVATAGFDVAEKVTLIGLTILGVATSSLIPAGAVAMKDGAATSARLARRATFWSALAVAPVVGVVVGAAEPITRALAGTTIPGTAAAVRWLAATTLVALVYAAAFEMTIGVGGAARIAPLTAIGLAINIVATIVLVRSYGLPGSAAASFIATASVAPLVTARTAQANGLRGVDLASAALPGVAIGAVLAAGSWMVVR